MTSRPLNEDLKTSQLPRQPSTQRVQMPEPGTTSLDLFEVRVASFPFGRCRFPICPMTPLFRVRQTWRRLWFGLL